ncbi:MAG: GGDEF domain-containing protein [Gammaproteobacteria bacterium]|nr:GGDEF domain-containing protein [Gammaproteobacteria bacterium]
MPIPRYMEIPPEPSTATISYREPATVTLLIGLFAYLSFSGAPVVDEVDVASLFFESSLAALPLLGLFVIVPLRATHPSAHRLVFAGLSALALAMTTDTLDELVTLPDYYNTFLEGLLQVVGFLLLLLGLRAWMLWNDALKLRLRELATTDYLTGAVNRRRLVEILDEQIGQCERYGQPLSLILLDLDRFKQLNDTHGHDAGDQQLVRVARLVQTRVRQTDCFARLGGEEFVVLTPQTDAAAAGAIAEKLRQALDDERTRPVVTASFGVVEYRPGETRTSLLKRADAALYQAKARGRNCVVQPDLAAGPPSRVRSGSA